MARGGQQRGPRSSGGASANVSDRERLSALEARHENLVGLVEEVARGFSSLSDDLRNYTRESEARQVAAQEADRRRIARLEAQSGTNWQTLFGAAGIAVVLGGIIASPHFVDLKTVESDAQDAEHRMDNLASRILVVETERRIERETSGTQQGGITTEQLRAVMDAIGTNAGVR